MKQKLLDLMQAESAAAIRQALNTTHTQPRKAGSREQHCKKLRCSPSLFGLLRKKTRTLRIDNFLRKISDSTSLVYFTQYL